MKRVELYLKVRRAVMIDGMSRRGAATYFGINRKTIDKMLVDCRRSALPWREDRLGISAQQRNFASSRMHR